MELLVQLGLIKHDRSEQLPEVEGNAGVGAPKSICRLLPSYGARESEMLYERERLAARRATVTSLWEGSAKVFGEGSPSSARASL